MKKVLGLMILAAFMFALPIGALAQVTCGTSEGTACSTALIAGNPKITRVVVGHVLYWTDCTNLYVKYVIDGDLTPDDPSDDGVPTLMYKTHLAVATNLDDIPQANGNAVPGKFKPYSRGYNPGVPSDQYIVSLASLGAGEDPLYIAAHAVVKKIGGLAGLEIALPATATVSVMYPFEGSPSYFPTVTVTNDGRLNGTYNGWCVDTDHVIYENTPYLANVYSSYENITGLGLVEFPQNFDLVNWIINQNYIGKPSASCGGNYTYGDIEYAIWSLIDDQTATSGLDGWSACRAAEIVAAAQARGEGFEPGCGDEVAVLLAPVSNAQVIIAQVIFAEIDVPCSSASETAWGEGLGFPGKNWSMYFTFTPVCAQPQ